MHLLKYTACAVIQVIHGVCEVWCFCYSSRSVSRVWQPPVSALLYMPAAFMLYTPALCYTAVQNATHHKAKKTHPTPLSSLMIIIKIPFMPLSSLSELCINSSGSDSVGSCDDEVCRHHLSPRASIKKTLVSVKHSNHSAASVSCLKNDSFSSQSSHTYSLLHMHVAKKSYKHTIYLHVRHHSGM